jgi:hypothetical protein
MRKLLLASAATIGATLAMSGGAKAQPVKPVAPGTLVAHVNGYIQFEIAAFGSTDNQVNTSTGAFKLNPITTDGDVRLYPGFDAQTVDGLEYGAQIELRTTGSDAGIRTGNNGTTGSSSSATSGISALYVKRAYGYLGAVDSGFVRLGQTDSVFSLDQTGVIEAFGDGSQFNTDGGVGNIIPTDASINGTNNFIFADQQNLYATDKIVYLSPAIAGFSAGIGFEPNSNGIKEGYANCAAASSANATPATTCADVSASPDVGDQGRRRKNTIDAALQYALSANGFVTKASVGVLYGAPIAYDGPALAAGTSALHFGYDNLEVYEAGVQTTFAGLTVGANIKGGQVEDGYYFKPKGARDALALIIGADYVVGPFVFGASYIDSQSAGVDYPGLVDTVTVGKGTEKITVGRTLDEYGIAVGGNYVISPHMSLFGQYMYDHRHQIGNTAIDASSTFTTAGGEYADYKKGSAQATILAAGVTVKW